MNVDPSQADLYMISEAHNVRTIDSFAAKAWIKTAKILYPNNFTIQFESYKLEKESNNYVEAAKSFNAIVMSNQNQNVELWNEIDALTASLRLQESELTEEQTFYVKMFQHVHYEVQQRILMLTINHMENSLNQCKLLVIAMQRFPQAGQQPRLLEIITEGMKQDPQAYEQLLIDEVLPSFLYQNAPELSPTLVCRLFTLTLEYYIRQILDEDTKCDSNELWKRIFQVLILCGKILHWETFLPFNKTWGQNVYWDKLIEIVASNPLGSPQVLFYATTLFIYSLHCYIKNCNNCTEDVEMNYILVEGFTDWPVERPDGQLDPPQISLTTNTSKEISKAFVHAAQCWQLLNTEPFQRDFNKLLLTLPLAPWISRFLFDLAIYFGHHEEAKKLMKEMTVKNNLVKNLQVLSLNLLQGGLNLQSFECILKIFAELPTTQGQFLEHLTLKVPRHMVFIPLTYKPIVQYCNKAIVEALSRKLYEPNCPDQILGDLLTILQLEPLRETLMVDQIFALISTRRSFSYNLFTSFIIFHDFLEEFLFLWNSFHDDCNFDLSSTQSGNSVSSRRIGTRGSDKGARDDFRLIIKQQFMRSNENINALVVNFVTQEQLRLVQNMFSVSETSVITRA